MVPREEGRERASRGCWTQARPSRLGAGDQIRRAVEDGPGRPSPLVGAAEAPDLPQSPPGLVPGPRHGLQSSWLAIPGSLFFFTPFYFCCFVTSPASFLAHFLLFFSFLISFLFSYLQGKNSYSFSLLSVYHFGAVTLSEAGRSQGPGYSSGGRAATGACAVPRNS